MEWNGHQRGPLVIKMGEQKVGAMQACGTAMEALGRKGWTGPLRAVETCWGWESHLGSEKGFTEVTWGPMEEV